MTKKSAAVSEIIDNIRRVFQVVNEKSKMATRATGLTGPQLWALKTIGQVSPVRVSNLARLMYLHPATIVGMLNRLELQGLIKRMRTNDDRRAVNVELTNAGKKLVEKAPQVAQDLLVAGLEELPLAKLQEIAMGLEELVHILGARELPPQLILSPEVNLPKRKIRAKNGHVA